MQQAPVGDRRRKRARLWTEVYSSLLGAERPDADEDGA